MELSPVFCLHTGCEVNASQLFNMNLFFEVTLKNGGGYEAICHRLDIKTGARSLKELHNNILDGIRSVMGEGEMPAMRDVHLVVTRE